MSKKDATRRCQKMSVLRNLLDILQGITVVLSFIIMVVEVVYEGVARAGEQKKKDVLEHWAQAKPIIVSFIREVFGDKLANLVDRWFNDKIISIMIDILVWFFNRTGDFKKS